MLPKIILEGPFAPGQITVRQVPSTLMRFPETEQAVDLAWAEAARRPGVRLFDGPVCRLESLERVGDRIDIAVSRTSYRVLVGTNFANPHFRQQYGPQVMANPIGVSAGLMTADRWILMGRRNGRVAYYPLRVHPFAGSLEIEPHIDLFANVRRELQEELSLSAADITGIVCLGLAEDAQLVHPEAVFMATTSLSRAKIDAMVGAEEHSAAWSVAAEPNAVAQSILDPALTPIARAVLMLWGKRAFGADWSPVLDHERDS